MTPSVVYLWSAGFDPNCRAIVIEPVREIFDVYANAWRTALNPQERSQGERTVPPAVPDLTTTCPECGGTCVVPVTGNGGDGYDRCERCTDGRVLRVFHAVEQWRPDYGGEWSTVPPTYRKWNDERRLAVIGWSTLTTEPLPVVDADTPFHDPCVAIYPNGDKAIFSHSGPGIGSFVHHKPWAADLVPGAVVLLLDPPTMLDQPITTMERLDSEGSPGSCNVRGCRATHPIYSEVPLALSAGLSVVELAS